MVTIIAGSRDITDYKILIRAIKASKFKVTAVISGNARGVDMLGIDYAVKKDIPCYLMPALWGEYGNQAGPIRNEAMALVCKHYSGGLIALWDGKSSGTYSMIKLAKKHKLKLFIYRTDKVAL